MPIHNQPFCGGLGDELKKELSKDYRTFYIFSAFAKTSGVLRIKPELENFKNNGGQIIAFIGVDLLGTSYEALLNLFNLCDKLVIVHSENSITFHSKIYALENPDVFWCAIGSNNLTKGGLWDNYESSYIQKHSTNPVSIDQQEILSLAGLYLDPMYNCSFLIQSTDDIDLLLNEGYVEKEARLHIQLGHKNKQIARSSIFGKEKMSAPTISTPKEKETFNPKNAKTLSTEKLEPATSAEKDSFIKDQHPLNEIFWFEMRKSTGASRNILDLSKTGKIIDGSPEDTRYEIHSDLTHCMGGVRFFGIDPHDVSVEKDITINYDGNDFFPSTIKYPDGPNANGTWRIQLKGENSHGIPLSQYSSRDKFVDNILIFEKIEDDYYVLTIADGNQLDSFKTSSTFWAVNGNSISSKAYGMLKINELEI